MISVETNVAFIKYQLDTTLENRLTLADNAILYNTRITHVAYNMEWLVTAESLDDLEHIPEVRLKFWKFDLEKKNYILCTHIESPHEGAVTALEFSSPTTVDNLLCASSGLDRKVKIWSLVESEIIDSGSPLGKSNGETSTSNSEWHFFNTKLRL